MIRIAAEYTDDFWTKINRRTNDIVTNIYDDIDIFMPDIQDDKKDDNNYSLKQQGITRENIVQGQFNTKSILWNKVYTNYNYPPYSFYKY